jgi:DNA polymerase
VWRISLEDKARISLRERILSCQKCQLSQGRKNAVPGEGNLGTKLIFVGEAPGRDEDIQGRPFVGRAGQLLTKIIHAMKFKREEVYITNIVKCRPPENRNPQKQEIEMCQDYLREQLEMIKPKVIVTLGKVATDSFVQSKMGMTALRGHFYEYNYIKVMPTFHPSYIIRNEGNNKGIKKMVWEDMQQVMAFLGKK